MKTELRNAITWVIGALAICVSAAFCIVYWQGMPAPVLDSKYSEDWQDRNFKDSQGEVFVEAWQSGDPILPPLAIIPDDSDWLVSGGTSSEIRGSTTFDRTVTIHIRKNAATISRVIRGGDYPLHVRYAALRDIDSVAMSPSQRLNLLEHASREPRAALRCMAALKASEHPEPQEVLGILVHLLSDPCIEVAQSVCWPLAGALDLSWKQGKQGWDTYIGSPEGLLKLQCRDVLAVAREVRRKAPALLSERDLQAIESRWRKPAG